MPHTSHTQMETDEVLRVKLKALKASHREMDEEISALQEAAAQDALTIKRMKKKKLQLKDEIAALEDKLTPDIIA